MPRKCPHCDRDLPQLTETATCPFCLERLPEFSVPPRVLDQTLFGGTLRPEDLQAGFASGSESTPPDSGSGAGGAGSWAEGVVSEASPADAWKDPSSREGASWQGDDSEVSGSGDQPSGGAATVGLGSGSTESGQAETAGPEIGFGGDRPLASDQGRQQSASQTTIVSAAAAVDGVGREAERDSTTERWARAAGSSLNPLHTIRSPSSSTVDSDSVELPIRPRSIVDEPHPQDRDADYHCIEEIGAGAMGVIHRAKQSSIDRFVAIKRIKPEGSGGRPEDERKISAEEREKRERQKRDVKRRFLKEAQITGGLDHPNIIPIHDLGVSGDGAIFYSMKLVEGVSWLEEIGKKSRDENLEILLKVCDAVAFAHSRDVIHRDLKPENVMLGQFGEVLVMDWGLAVALGADSDRKISFGGTPAYMAPEMAQNDQQKIGRASDIYLLGAILFEIVTGKPPHPTVELPDRQEAIKVWVRAAAVNEIIPVSQADDDLLDIAMRAMATEPGDRYRTVTELQEAIRGYRRNSQSIALSQRAEQKFAEAKESQNYQVFSKALIGFEDALEMWPENQTARQRIDQVRLEYGRASLRKGDFDLTLQLLRDESPEERKLIAEAVKRKREAEQRERRIRRLRGTVVAVVGVAFLGASAAAWQIDQKRQVAVDAQRDANDAREAERKQREDAEKARERADKDRDRAIRAQEAADREKDHADRARKAEQEEREKAEKEKNRALVAQQKAEKAEKQEQKQREEAEKARNRAERESRLNLFRNFPAKLSLASIRIRRQQDVDRSGDLLREIDDLMSELGAISIRDLAAGDEAMEGGVDAPSERRLHPDDWQNWVYRRTRLLANADLPRIELRDHGVSGQTLCGAVASASDYVAVGTDGGEVAVIGYVTGGFELLGRGKFQPPIKTIAISPDGDTVYLSSDDQAWAWDWQTDKRSALGQGAAKTIHSLDPTPHLALVPEAGNVSFHKAKPDYEEIPGLRLNGRVTTEVLTRPGSTTGDLRFAAVESAKKQSKIYLSSSGSQQVALRFPPGVHEVRDVAFLDEDRFIARTNQGKSVMTFRIGVCDQSERQKESERQGICLESSFGEDVHATAIERLTLSRNRRWMLSTALADPAIRLWRSLTEDPTEGWATVCPVLGHGTSPVRVLAFSATGNRVVSIDESGRCILWDPRSQALQARATNRINPSLPIGAGVISKRTGNVRPHVLTLNQDGTLDRWDALSSQDPRQPDDQRAWDYIGHLPKSEVREIILTRDGTRLVTAAVVGEQPYLDAKREFCVWDLDAQKVLMRWSDRLEWSNTLLERYLPLEFSRDESHLFVGGNPCHAVPLEDPSRRTQLINASSETSPAGQSLAQNPKKDVLAVTNLGGDVHFFRSTSPFDLLDYRASKLQSGKVLRSAWDPTGTHLFLVVKNQLHALRWNGTEGDAPRATVSLPGLSIDTDGLAPRDVDLVVTQEASGPHAYVTIRTPSTEARGYAFRLDTDRFSLESQTLERPSGVEHLIPQDPSKPPRRLPGKDLKDLIGEDLKIRFVAAGDQGKRLVLADDQGNFRVQGAGTAPVLIRRGPFVKAEFMEAGDDRWRGVGFTTSQDLWCVQSDPVIGSKGRPHWSRLQHEFRSIRQIALSAGGQYLAIVGDVDMNDRSRDTVEIWRWDDGEPELIRGPEMPHGIEHFLWHPQRDEWVAWQAEGPEGPRLVRGGPTAGWREVMVAAPKGLSQSEKTVGQMTFFSEPKWGRKGDEPDRNWYVAMQLPDAEGTSTGSRLRLVDFRSVGDDRPAQVYEVREDLGRIAKLAASPTENLLAIGTQSGTVSLWLIAPSLEATMDLGDDMTNGGEDGITTRPVRSPVEISAYEVHDFEDHRGSEITTLRFSADGETLLSGDRNGYQHLWLSRAVPDTIP